MLYTLKHSLIVSCQSPKDSPLHHPQMIAAMAEASVLRGAAGVRIDSPSHVQAVRQKLPKTPIIGLWKQQISNYDVYITPQFKDAVAIAQAGADIIAIDATKRDRPNQETVPQLIQKIHQKLKKRVMADIDTLENAQFAIESGADIVGTTLFGYTQDTQNQPPPGWQLLETLVTQSPVPVICEGGIATPEMTQKALKLGAYAVVVGTAITGIDLKVEAFMKAI